MLVADPLNPGVAQRSGLFLTAERRFLILYIVALLMVFSPSKALGQLSALLFIAGLIVFVRIRTLRHMFVFWLFGLVYIGLGIAYLLFMPGFLIVNYALVLVTTSALLILLCDFSTVATPWLLRKVGLCSLGMISFQAMYGFIQAAVAFTQTGSLDLANGDFVRGTIEPGFDFIPSASNPIYAILLSVLLLMSFALTSGRPSPINFILYMLVAIAWVLASVMHTILFFLAAVVATVIIWKLIPGPRSVLKTSQLLQGLSFATILLLVAVLVPLLLPQNFSTIPVYLERTLDISPLAASEKARATFYTLYVLPEDRPIQPWIGLGPGQYSSRASLMLSGEYLRDNPLRFLGRHVSPETDRYILELWRQFLAFRPNGGSTYFPFYSWLSVYGELGMIGISLTLSAIGTFVLTFRRRVSAVFPRLPFALTVLILYLALLGLQDNYWEFTQAMLPALILLKLGYDYLNNEHNAQRQASIAVDRIPSERSK